MSRLGGLLPADRDGLQSQPGRWMGGGVCFRGRPLPVHKLLDSSEVHCYKIHMEILTPVMDTDSDIRSNVVTKS